MAKHKTALPLHARTKQIPLSKFVYRDRHHISDAMIVINPGWFVYEASAKVQE
ncbi:hypothetical protein W02_41220 [Nitrospira sp. KM1]|nr:hypothetical protein W02_41220 [Nitrospira sp. KM1]